MIRPLSNVKFYQFLQEVVIQNRLLLWEIKELKTHITKLISYCNCHSVTNSVSDLNLIIKLLVEDVVFDYQPNREKNNSEFTKLYSYRKKSIVIKGPPNSYQYRPCGKWKLRLSLNSRLLATKVDKKCDINIIEGILLFFNSKVNHDSNNYEENEYLYCNILLHHINIVFNSRNWLRSWIATYRKP